MKKNIHNLGIFIIGLVLLFGCKEENSLAPELVYPNDPFIGIGTKDDPYDVSSAIRRAKKETISWVTGFIVGAVKKGTTEIIDANSIAFDSENIEELTLLLASEKDETDYTQCLVVSLDGANSGLINNLNLANNKDNLGNPVAVCGKLDPAILGVSGMKEVENGTINKTDIPIYDSNNPLNLMMNTYTNVVATEFDDIIDGATYTPRGWTNRPTKGLVYWKGNMNDEDQFISVSTQGVAKDKELESWFVTPAFKAMEGKSFSFDYLIENPSANTALEVYFWVESGEEMEAKPLNVENIQVEANGVWKREVKFNLDEYANTIGFVGFKYSTVTDGNIQRCSLDNLKYGGMKVLFFETFDANGPITPSGSTVSVNDFTGYDNPGVFSRTGGIADLRCITNAFDGTNVLSCIYGWGGNAFEDTVILDVSAFIPEEGYSKMTLSFDVGGMDQSRPLNWMKIYCDDVPVTVPSISIPLWSNTSASIELPIVKFNKIKFHFKGDGTGFGHCFDNIKIIGE